MRITFLFFALAVGMVGESSFKVSRAGHLLVLDGVFLNGAGPFRMAIDTGNASSEIRADVARRVGVRPDYAVEQVTAAGIRRAPAANVPLKVGAVTDRSVEVMIGDVGIEGVDGVLGQSWLVQHDYLLDYQHRRLVIDGAAAVGGFKTALHSTDGRPLINAVLNGEKAEMVLDSGSAVVMMCGDVAGITAGIAFRANGGFGVAQDGSAQVEIEGDRERRMKAARVRCEELLPAAVPASVFKAVMVSNRHGFVQVVP
jgi:predicted aspartyl protease